jgi:hypothetical protein
MCLACGDGLLQSLGIHVANHEQFTAGKVGGDGWQQAAGIELGRKVVPLLDLFDG